MNKVLVAVAVLIPLLLCYQEAAAVSISFDSFTNDPGGNGEMPGNAFEQDGIIFSTPDLALNLAASGLSSPNRNCLGADSSNTGALTGKVIFEFTGNRVSNDLRFFGVSNFFTMSAKAFDINGNFVSEKSVFQSNLPVDFTGFPVHKVEATSGDAFCIYDVSFNLINEQPGDGGANDKVIGGKIILIDSTGLLLAGVTTSAFWFIPAILSGAGLIVYKLRKN